MSYRQISAALAEAGYLSEVGEPYHVRALQPKIETESDVRARRSPSKQQVLALQS
jgi:hypothetical protein